ncbi:hypothetical protein [Oceaniradius stylonematis]|uniref:hypothetical protein n=1 Tax=Oceaniradius stylonematis TaxID=2184161 RepID=UPI00273D0417|nr:hypothetical protein [Oceaniradius stylonematis]
MRAALHLDIGKKGPSIPLDTLFSTASTPAIPGWLTLLASPFAPRVAHIAAGRAVHSVPAFALGPAFIG